MTQVAQMHYLQGLTRVEIAKKLNISRFKIGRVLESALEVGVVTITIRPAGLVDGALSTALTQRFALTEAQAVFTTNADPDALYSRLGQVAANLLSRVVTRDDVLGIDAGRTVSHIADHLITLPACDVVQLSGLAGSVQQTGLDIMRRVSEASGGTAYPLYAPMIAINATSAVALRHQPNIQETMDHYRQVTVAVVSIGSWIPPVSRVHDLLSPDDRGLLLEAGVAAETCALMFDNEGQAVPHLDDRRIGIPLDVIRQIPNVIAVAGGVDKANGIRALLKSRIINTLITDTETAKLLLKSPDLALPHGK